MLEKLTFDLRTCMAAVTLRKANHADAAPLGALHVASWRETYIGLLPDEMLRALSVEARTAMWSKILAAPDDFGCAAVFIAEDQERVVGFGSCAQQRDGGLIDKGFSGEFGAIYVLRSYQGRGVGRSMMEALSSELSAAGHSAASLWVLRENAPARAFYEALGGIIVGEKVDEWHGAALVEDAYGWRDLSSLGSS